MATKLLKYFMGKPVYDTWNEGVTGMNNRYNQVTEGSLVLVITQNEKKFLLKLQAGRRFHSHIGTIEHDALIGQPFGTTFLTASRQPILLLKPTLSDLMLRLRRATQIIYPKDAALIIQRLALRSGSVVLESGTGSGSLTTALAWSVAPEGKVISVESNSEMYEIARQNLIRYGLHTLVEMHLGYLENWDCTYQVDAVVLDMREPWRAMNKVRSVLKRGGNFVSFLPTTNQVSTQMEALEQSGFAEIQIEEIWVRRYKPIPDRLRPEDQMIAHTGYIVSARLIHDPDDPRRWLSRDRLRYLARQEATRRYEARQASRQEGSPASNRPSLPP